VIAGNNNVVKAIINGTCTEDCVIDTVTYLTFLYKAFVKSHGLQLVPVEPGATCVYMAAGKT